MFHFSTFLYPETHLQHTYGLRFLPQGLIGGGGEWWSQDRAFPCCFCWLKALKSQNGLCAYFRHSRAGEKLWDWSFFLGRPDTVKRGSQRIGSRREGENRLTNPCVSQKISKGGASLPEDLVLCVVSLSYNSSFLFPSFLFTIFKNLTLCQNFLPLGHSGHLQ